MRGIEQFLQVDAATLGALKYAGTWNASTNTPTLASGVGVQGQYYVVSVAGSTNLDGETAWQVGDWAVFNGSVWQKVDGGSTGLLTTLTVTGNTYLATTSGNVGVGTTSPQRLLVVDGGASGAVLQLTNNAAGNTAGNGLELVCDGTNAFFSNKENGYCGFSTNNIERMRITAAGDVGIGTTSPAYKLDVAGDIRGTGTNGLRLTNVTGTDLRNNASGTILDSYSASAVLAFHTQSTERMRLDASGNLGLGVAPSAWSLPAIESQYGLYSGRSESNLVYNAYFNSGFKYISTGVEATRYQQVSGRHQWFNAPSGTAGNAITFTQAMTLDASGNLGVGTATPAYKLDVVGSTSTARFGKLIVVDDTPFYTGANINSGANSLGVGSTGATHVGFFTNNLERMRVSSGGDVGIGVTPMATGANGSQLQIGSPTVTPGAGLTIGCTTTADIQFSDSTSGTGQYAGLIRYSHANDSMGFWTASAERLRITAAGNVGIGTTSPSERLHVSGGGSDGAIRVVGGASGNGYLIARTTGEFDVLNVANAALRFYTNSSVRATIDAAGNLGLGVTPSAWSGLRGFDIAAGGALFAGTSQAGISTNAAFTGTNWVYKNTDTAAYFRATGNAFQWHQAASGTAGNTISFTQAMTLDASGNLGIGTTSPDAKLDVVSIALAAIFGSETANNAYIGLKYNSTTLGYIGNGAGVAAGSGATDFSIGSTGARALTFGTNDTERARIPSAGGMVVGTAALATSATDGFLYVPTCAGTPTGTPTTQTGTAPIVIDTTNNKLYFYSGGQWRDAGP